MQTDLAGSYRPKCLDDVVGQDVVVRTLTNAFTKKNLHHAYLFVGTFGGGKCVGPDTLVYTRDGLRRIKSLVSQTGVSKIDVEVYDESGTGYASNGYCEQNADTLKITTRDGFFIEATKEHKLRVFTDRGMEWKRSDEIQVGDFLPIYRNTCSRPTDLLKTHPINWQFDLTAYLDDRFGIEDVVECRICHQWLGNLSTHIPTHSINSKRYRKLFPNSSLTSPSSLKKNFINSFSDLDMPTEFSFGLARLFGYIVSEGNISDCGINVTNADDQVINDITAIVSSEFAVQPSVTYDKRTKNTYCIRICYRKISEFAKYYQLTGNSFTKRIPDVVFEWPKSLICEFIKAYFEGDGGVEDRSVACCSRSLGLIQDLQTLLLSLGIVSFIRHSNKHATNGRSTKKTPAYILTIYSENMAKFAKLIGFVSTTKKKKLSKRVNRMARYNPNKDIIPFIQSELFAVKQCLHVRKNGYLIVDGVSLGRFQWPQNVRDRINPVTHKNCTYENIQACVAYFENILQKASEHNVVFEHNNEIKSVLEKCYWLLDHKYFFSPVESIILSRNDVFDICKDGSDHSFIANGMINHNTSAARILAAMENCETSPGLHPCGKCRACKLIFDGVHTDVIEIDAASSAGKVDQIREIKRDALYNPIDGAKKKYFIIDEFHKCSSESADALLKLIEEPPEHCRFVLCTTDVQKVKPTILSRCQRHDFGRIYWMKISDHLANVAKLEKIHVDQAALNLCAKMSSGSMRQALQHLEKLVSFSGDEKITIEHAQKMFGSANYLFYFDLIDQILGKGGIADSTEGFTVISKMLSDGADFIQVYNDLVEHLRTLMIVLTASKPLSLIHLTEEGKHRLKDQIKKISEMGGVEGILECISKLNNIRVSVDYNLPAETALQHWFLESVFIMRKPR